jgi:hypothetical protein
MILVKKQAGFGFLSLLLSVALVTTISMAFMLWADNFFKNANEAQWNKTASEVIDSAIEAITLNQITSGGVRGIPGDTHTLWLIANIGSDKILVNPVNSLCNMRIRPPQQSSYQPYDYQSLNAFVDATGTKTQKLEVKPVSSSWFDADDKDNALRQCKDLNFDGATVTYQGKEMYELLKVN